MKTECLILFGLLAMLTPFAPAQNTTSSAAAYPSGFCGKVVDTTNTSGYTYVQVDTGSNKLWAVTTQFPVKLGDNVTVGPGMPMDNYHSKSLNRDFDMVYFTGSISVNGTGAGAMPVLPPGHPPLTAPAPSPALDFTGIKKAEGGKTIKEIYAAKARLAGKTVSVRGKVVKYNAMILGKNWLHIQDGSGSADKGDNDLTVTTTTPAAPGDTVLVTGNVSTNRDFGAGYKYNVIIEDAKVTVE